MYFCYVGIVPDPRSQSTNKGAGSGTRAVYLDRPHSIVYTEQKRRAGRKIVSRVTPL